jgi:hypothetical protein
MFVHAGLIHLGFNMWMLISIGSRGERMWGPGRFLLLYFLSGLCSSFIAVAQQPLIPEVGASGALCGLLGAEIVWVLLNGRYLPADIRKRWRFGLIMNVVLIALMGFMPGVSNWGHLGGALTGVAVGVLLNFQRFGPSPWRWLAVPVLAALPVAGWMLIRQYRATSKEWEEAEKAEYAHYYEKPADNAGPPPTTTPASRSSATRRRRRSSTTSRSWTGPSASCSTGSVSGRRCSRRNTCKTWRR